MRKELESFSQSLARKNEIILLTKSDTVKSDELKNKIKLLKKYSKTLLHISIYHPEEIDQLKKTLINSF